MRSEIFFRPAPHWVGDVIPFSDGERLCLYYLYERRTQPKPGTPWALTTTTDLVHYEDRGIVLPSGGPQAEDHNAYTGSIVQDDEGLHHLFYTASNPERPAADGRPLQLVSHATSIDGERWDKHPEDTFGAPAGYDPADWRDPFVYRLPGEDQWSMILAARHAQGADRRRGVVARLTSHDLRRWRMAAPLWDPRRFVTQECPEVFRIGQWWYLVYSEFTDRFVTRYRMSRSPHGPWTAPAHDTLDGRGFYAAKSADLHGRRLFFGWIASRSGARDDGPWLWAGTMACLEASQNEDGSLSLSIPTEVLEAYDAPMAATSPTAAVGSREAYGAAVLTDILPDDVAVGANLSWEPGTRETGLLIRTDAEGETGYMLRLEPVHNRLVLDRWPRRAAGTEQWHLAGDIPHVIELERPVDLSAGRARIDLIMSHELLQCCVNTRVCLSTSVYDHPSGRLGLFSLDGETTLTGLSIRTRA